MCRVEGKKERDGRGKERKGGREIEGKGKETEEGNISAIRNGRRGMGMAFHTLTDFFSRDI